ncbi:MAG: hypothetical protein RMK89_03065 [Armatimonadota bacterium]|nr:hypothetical protein [Armatimonadota bacterium]MDW8142424.1 hypothetical protein [Armatimonadota bacterium]
MNAVPKERRRFINSRRFIAVISATVLLSCCVAAWHFASAPRPIETSYHRPDTPAYRCLGCHYYGKSGPKMTHRLVNFCYPCHRPRKAEQKK